MGNINVVIKRILSNKNTVTVLGVVAAVLVLYFGYNSTVNKAITPITVPYAKDTIKPGAQITEDMIGTKNVSSETVADGLAYTNINEVKNKYANADSVIPKGSLFYKRSVVEKNQLPDEIIYDYPEGYVLYYLNVSTETTYGNAIYPGNYIDIYLKAQNAQAEGENIVTSDKIMVGKLLENIKVIAVNDANGNNVFADVDENRTPATLIFAVPQEYYILLNKAKYLRSVSTTLIPVPTAESLKDNPGDLKLSSEELKNYINSITVWTE
ncbi:MAG: RcpC/CpaB family pilus assembly protein [bacterium]|nr:RcpC/CpaB family pilus assembly protein [bacterium]